MYDYGLASRLNGARLGMAGGSPNEDSSEYPTIQSPGFGQRENDTVNVAKPHTI